MKFIHQKGEEPSLIEFVLGSAIWALLIPKCNDFAFWWACLVLYFFKQKNG